MDDLFSKLTSVLYVWLTKYKAYRNRDQIVFYLNIT